MNETPQAVQELAKQYNKDPAQVLRIYNLYIKLGYKKDLAEAMAESDIINERKH